MTDEGGAAGPKDRRTGRRLAAIVFADVAGYTELSSRDEDLALAVIEAFQTLATQAVNEHGGRVVKFLGDGMLAEFGSLDAGVASSHALQKAFSVMEEAMQAQVALRVGVHLGDVVFSEDGDIHGSGVNVASRIEGHAPPSGIVVSDSAYRQLRNRRAYTFSSIGEHALKGVPDPMELYVVLLEGQQPPAPAVRVIKDVAPASSGAGWSFLRWAFGITLTVAVAAYAADVRGVRDAAVQAANMVGISLGATRTAVQPPTFAAVEGGAEVAGPVTLEFTGPVDPASATSSSIQLFGPGDASVPLRVTVRSDARAVSLEPEMPLAYGTRYRIVLSSLLRSASGDAIDLPGGASTIEERLAFSTQPVPEGAPVVLQSSPADGATGVAGNAAIAVTFDQPMDEATVNSTTVAMLDDAGRPVETALACCGETGDRLEVRPAGGLAGGPYTVELGRGLADRDGEFLAQVALAFEVREASVSAPAPTGPGRLTVRVAPSELTSRTILHLDGEAIGQPPLENRTVRESVPHRVEIFATPEVPGGELMRIFDQSVTLRPGETTVLEAAVTPFGSVSIIATPVGEAFIDGQSVGSTPLMRHLVSAGVTHRLEIRPIGDDAATHGIYSVEFTVEPLASEGLGRVTLPPRG